MSVDDLREKSHEKCYNYQKCFRKHLLLARRLGNGVIAASLEQSSKSVVFFLASGVFVKTSSYEYPKFTLYFGATQSIASNEGCHLPLSFSWHTSELLKDKILKTD